MSAQERTEPEIGRFERYRKGLRTATANNGSAYAYSIYVTMAFSIVERRDPAGPGDLYLFILGAAIAFAMAEAAVSNLFRVRLRGEDNAVLALGNAMSGVAAAAGLAASHAVTESLTGGWRWLVSPFAGTLAFLIALALSMDMGRRISERIPHESEHEQSPRSKERG